MHKTEPHKLFVALLWDSEGLGVFDRPAPIWPGDTKEVWNEWNNNIIRK